MTKLKLTGALLSNQNSRYKKRNEDAGAWSVVVNKANVPISVGIVADGITGSQGGHLASQHVVVSVLDSVEKSTVTEPRGLTELILDGWDQLNTDVLGFSETGAGTTFTGIFIFPGGENLTIHIGDSRLYYVTPSECRLVTTDHSEVALAKNGGAMDEELDSMHQHALARCIGMVGGCEPDVIINDFQFSDDGVCILTTDGCHDVMSSLDFMTMVSNMSDLQMICENAILYSLSNPNTQGRANKDNITILAIASTNSRFGRGALLDKVKNGRHVWIALVGILTGILGLLGILYFTDVADNLWSWPK